MLYLTGQIKQWQEFWWRYAKLMNAKLFVSSKKTKILQLSFIACFNIFFISCVMWRQITCKYISIVCQCVKTNWLTQVASDLYYEYYDFDNIWYTERNGAQHTLCMIWAEVSSFDLFRGLSSNGSPKTSVVLYWQTDLFNKQMGIKINLHQSISVLSLYTM